MVKNCLIFIGVLLFALPSPQNVQGESIANDEDIYVTTGDIISDIIFHLLIRRL